MRILLASESPRRAELLAAAGYEFDVAPAPVDETPRPGEPPREYVARLAGAKAAAIAAGHAGRPVLGADTIVVLHGEMLGKPGDERAAAAMLRRLSGQTHEVLTGVAIRFGTSAAADVESTRVGFAALSDEQIAWYVASGEPKGKAGAYAIQGLAARFVDRLEGSYQNVVGLPIALVERLLRELGISA